MKFIAAPLEGSYVIEREPVEDERGFFARAFCRREFEEQGLCGDFVQWNVSGNERAGTIRGLHRQLPPHAEVKLIRCSRGALYDVIIDLRPDSATYRQHFGIELTADGGRMLYVPEGFAQGYQAIEPGAEASYVASAFYEPSSERGVRWNDPAFGIRWPIADPILSEKDRSLPDFSP